MREFFAETEIDAGQAEAMARGLFAVARADGEVHPREMALIGELYAATIDSPSQLGDLERSPDIEASALAAHLSRPELAAVFLKTALLLAYVDGVYGAGEKRLIESYAQALGVAADQLAELNVQVKEYLLGHLAQLENVEAVVQVKRELDAGSAG